MSVVKLQGPAAAAIRALAARSPAIARRLVSWTPSYAHALSALLQARDAAASDAAKALFAPDGQLAELDTADLLGLSGFPVPRRLVPLLDALGAQLQRLDAYRRWDTLMEDRSIACFVAGRRRRVTAPQMEALAALHPDLRCDRIMSMMAKPADAETLHLLVKVVGQYCPDAQIRDIHRSLRHTKADLDEWMEKWLARATLPAPPFPGSERLVPLRSAAEIARCARRFRNCLNGYRSQALDGSVAFYLWAGTAPVLVSLERMGKLGWKVSEILGPDNKPPPRAVKTEILGELRGWGCQVDAEVWASLRRLGVSTYA